MGHAKYTQHRITYQPTALEHVGYFGKWPRAVRISSPGIPQNNTPEDDDLKVLTVFETFASNNRRKRALRELAKVCQIAAINPWNDTAITFNVDDEPKFRTVRAPAALVLSPIVDGIRLTKVLMDGGSGLNVTPAMRLYLPRVEARLRGITELWFCRKKGHLHTIPCNEQDWDKELAYNRHFTQYIIIIHKSFRIHT